MGLMVPASAPFGPTPAGTLSSDGTLYLEPTPKRVRVVLGGETIADSRRAMLLHEQGHQPLYYFPPEDVVADVLEPSDRHTRCPRKGEASYYSVRVGSSVVEAGAWYYPEVLAGAPPGLAGLIAFYWDRLDAWLEEDQEVFGHARDPYHRIDLLSSDRRVRVSLEGDLLAESTRAVALFETGLPPRWYLPREDVALDLEPSETVTLCPYKGQASYYSVAGEKDLVWTYEHPLPEASAIAGLVCFWNERVDLELDGELCARPESPWRHGVRAAAPAGS